MVHVEFTIQRRHLIALAGMLVAAALLVPGVAWASSQFTDVPEDNVFSADISWLADVGVTKGCNPPANDKFCPGSDVTREQMAAFMHRLAANKIVDAATAINADQATNGGEIDTRLDALEAVLAGVTRDGDTLMFEGMNLQIANGQGETETSNGLGNVIIGYNEDSGGDDIRTGSHYLIVGTESTYSSYSGIVAGRSGTATGEYASVLGGQDNRASGRYSTVLGGFHNHAAQSASTVAGGSENWANGYAAAVAGGDHGIADGEGASVTGGQRNTASGSYSSVTGGSWNQVVGELDTVVGGDNVINISWPGAIAIGEGFWNGSD